MAFSSGAVGSGTTRRGGRRRRRSKAVMAEINMTPFIDVMLVLLIVFMIAAPLLSVGVPVDLPESTAPDMPQETKPLTLTVRHGGALFVGDVPVSADTLLQAIRNQSQRNGVDTPEEQRLLLRADRTVPYEEVMAVMGALASGGFTKIGLITDRERVEGP